MRIFDYVAYEKDRLLEGDLAGPSADDVIRELQGRGYFVVALSERVQASVLDVVGLGFLTRRRALKTRELIQLSRRLATLLRGGLPILRALSSLGRSQNFALARSIAELRQQIAAGISLSQAMVRQADIFPALLRGLVAAGESAGSVVTVLQQYSKYLERQFELRRKIVGALTYPFILIQVALGLMMLLSVRVVPTFAKIFASFHMKLPALTLAVLGFSAFLRSHWVTLAVWGFAVGLLVNAYAQTSEGREDLCRFERKLPYVGRIFIDIWHERMFATLAMALNSGVSIVQSLVLLEEVFEDNPLFCRGIRATRDRIVKGDGIAKSLRSGDFLSVDDTDAIESAEEAGTVADCMEELALGHAEDVDYRARQLTSVIEPVMVLLIGAVVGVMMLALFLPMAELANIRPM